MSRAPLRSWLHHRARHLGWALACVVAWLAPPEEAAAEPPQFGIELEAGQVAGLTPYLRNEIFLDPVTRDGELRYRPYLGDLETATGTNLAVRLVAEEIAAGLTLRFFDVERWSLHHAGDTTLAPSRVRPDNSVDDAGVEYERLDAPDQRFIDEPDQATLLIFGLSGAYRFIWSSPRSDLFIPVGGQVVVTTLTEPASPYRLGFEVNSGLGAAFEFIPDIALMAVGRVHALATTHYGRLSDAAYRAATVDESTEAALFSTQLSASINLGVQFHIR